MTPLKIPVEVDASKLRGAFVRALGAITDLGKAKLTVDVDTASVSKAGRTAKATLQSDLSAVKVHFDEREVMRDVSRISTRAKNEFETNIGKGVGGGIAKGFAEAIKVISPGLSKAMTANAESGGASGVAGRMGAMLMMANVASRFAGAAMTSAGGVGRNIGLASSSDPMLSRQGTMGILKGAEDIPILGHVVKGFNDMTGITASLETQIRAIQNIEARQVSIARLTRDPTVATGAEIAAERRAMARELETAKSNRTANTVVGSLFGGPGGGMAAYRSGTDAINAVNSEIAAAQPEFAERIRVAGIERSAMRRAPKNEAYATFLRSGGRDPATGAYQDPQPMAADRFALNASLTERLDSAPIFMRSIVAKSNALMKASLDESQKRLMDRIGRATNASITTSGLQMLNSGGTIAAGTYARLASLDENIRETPTEGGLRDMARNAALAEAGAMRESLAIHGGATVGASNVALQRMGDPYNLIPMVRDRASAYAIADSYAGKRGLNFRSLNPTFSKDAGGGAAMIQDAMARGMDQINVPSSAFGVNFGGENATQLLQQIATSLRAIERNQGIEDSSGW